MAKAQNRECAGRSRPLGSYYRTIRRFFQYQIRSGCGKTGLGDQSMNILVTGDIVLDCHLYGGVKTGATSFSEPGTEYSPRLGGAALTRDILCAAAKADVVAKGAAWDEALQAWNERNELLQKEGKPPEPRPDDLPKTRPSSPAYDAILGLDDEELDELVETLPTHLRSYGVWIDQPSRKGAKDRVWRVERHFGYGPTDINATGSIFKRTKLPESPSLTLIDDGSILYRHDESKHAWPDFSKGSGYYLLKTSSPLARGDLWEALDCVRERLIVVLYVNDLRREDAQISARLS